jgi:hypothetical protein|tara:strand:- start:471 stop:872 length:402 start_codon:yes stop_codon:yes gene_type:complete
MDKCTYGNDWDAMAERFNVPVKKLYEMKMSFKEEILINDITEEIIKQFKQEEEFAEDKDLDYYEMLEKYPEYLPSYEILYCDGDGGFLFLKSFSEEIEDNRVGFEIGTTLGTNWASMSFRSLDKIQELLEQNY